MDNVRLAKARVTQPIQQPTGPAHLRKFWAVLTYKSCPHAMSTLGHKRGLGHVSKYTLANTLELCFVPE